MMKNDFIEELGNMLLGFEEIKKIESSRHMMYICKGKQIFPMYGEVKFFLREEMYDMYRMLCKNTEMLEEEVFELIMYYGMKSIYNQMENEGKNNAI